MSLAPDTLNAIKTLIEQDPALLENLRQATEPGQAARLIATAAAGQGLALDVDALTAHFAEQLKTGETQISDEQLEGVAGGLLTEGGLAALSIFSLGIGCFIYSNRNPSFWFASCENK